MRQEILGKPEFSGRNPGKDVYKVFVRHLKVIGNSHALCKNGKLKALELSRTVLLRYGAPQDWYAFTFGIPISE
jgi:hypothetical protein